MKALNFRSLTAGTVEETIYQHYIYKQDLIKNILIDQSLQCYYETEPLCDLFPFAEATKITSEIESYVDSNLSKTSLLKTVF